LNILLIAEKVSSLELPVNGEAGTHILQVFNAKLGDTIDIGVCNGPRGKAIIVRLNKNSLKLSIKWNQGHTNDLYPVGLLVGLSRPQTCRKILEQASTLGVSSIDFFISDKSEPSYRDSKLWKTKEWEEKIQKGVEQAFCTYIPRCTIWSNLAECIESQCGDSYRIALDNYESTGVLTSSGGKKESTHYLVAVGAERGWSDAERKQLRASEFLLLSLGDRVLRQETAVVVAIGQLVSQFWKS
jgi:RsmE family RNA methyltransferase